MSRGNYSRALIACVLGFTMVLAGCSTDWVREAQQIVAVLIPAATNIVTLTVLLSGKNVSAADLQVVQSAGTQATADLNLIQSLLKAYQQADETAKPGVLSQIQSAVAAVEGNLEGILPALHIKDTATQGKIAAVVGVVLAEVQSLAAIVPVVKGGAPTLSALNAARVEHSGHRALSASEFVAAYNSALVARSGSAAVDSAAAGLRIRK